MGTKSTKLFITSFIMTLSLSACGGGGGGDIAVPDYSGGWSTSLSLVSNSCPRQIPSEFTYLYPLHNVDQNLSQDAAGNYILDVVLNDGADTYVGVGEIGENGNGNRFSVTGSPHELPGFLTHYVCIETIDFNYESISKDDSNNLLASYVSRHSSITCTRGTDIKTCDVTYTGTSFGAR